LAGRKVEVPPFLELLEASYPEGLVGIPLEAIKDVLFPGKLGSLGQSSDFDRVFLSPQHAFDYRLTKVGGSPSMSTPSEGMWRPLMSVASSNPPAI